MRLIIIGLSFIPLAFTQTTALSVNMSGTITVTAQNQAQETENLSGTGAGTITPFGAASVGVSSVANAISGNITGTLTFTFPGGSFAMNFSAVPNSASATTTISGPLSGFTGSVSGATGNLTLSIQSQEVTGVGASSPFTMTGTGALSGVPVTPVPTVSSVQDDAGGTSFLSPGMPVQVIGTGFGTSATDSATVMIGTAAAPVLSFVSATDLIVQVPVDAPLGPTTLSVTYKGQTSQAFNIKLLALAPQIEPNSFVNQSGNPITTATPGSDVSLLAIGLGPTNPPQATNTVATAQAPTTQQVEVMVGTKMVQPSYAGLDVGGMPGLYKVSFAIPDDAAMAMQPVTLSVGGSTSNPQTLTIGPPIPLINAVVNGATFAPGPAPAAANSFVSLFGTNFGTQNTAGNIFPAKVFDGLSVLVDGTAIPLYVVVGTGGQINIVLPSELGASGSASVEVQTSEGASAAYQLALAPDSVGIFRIADPSDKSRMNGAVLFTNTAWKVMPLSMAAALGFPLCSAVTTASVCGKPAQAGDQIEIYLTGLGKATPNGDPNGRELPTGSLAPTDGSVLYKTVETPVVKIGGVQAVVSFSGIAPGNAGQYQINVQVPSGVQPGDDVTLTVTMPDGSTDTVTIAITG